MTFESKNGSIPQAKHFEKWGKWQVLVWYIGLCPGVNTHSKHPTSLIWVQEAIPALYQYQLSSDLSNTSLVSVLYQPQDQVYWGRYKTSTVHQYMYALMYKHRYCMCMYIKNYVFCTHIHNLCHILCIYDIFYEWKPNLVHTLLRISSQFHRIILK
jgi:hypothetical protein